MHRDQRKGAHSCWDCTTAEVTARKALGWGYISAAFLIGQSVPGWQEAPIASTANTGGTASTASTASSHPCSCSTDPASPHGLQVRAAPWMGGGLPHSAAPHFSPTVRSPPLAESGLEHSPTFPLSSLLPLPLSLSFSS